MRVVGIVAEYNPFHNGHIWHMQQAMELTQASYCIVAMSGNFVQRGEPACADKYMRAEWAVYGGADLVLEIPTIYSLSSAERFAEGALLTLAATGVVTDLAFGCELCDLRVLKRIADILDDEPPEFKLALERHLRIGLSYPQARHNALRDIGIAQEYLVELTKQNNILAVEYLRAIKRLNLRINPVPIPRTGNAYSETELTGVISSATSIRLAMEQHDPSATLAVPAFTALAMQYNSCLPITSAALGSLTMYKLRLMSQQDIKKLPDVAEGLENLFFRAVRECSTLDEVLTRVKSRRYTMARIKRIAMCALLDISDALIEDMSASTGNLYMKVLARKRITTALISSIKSISRVPLLLRNSDMQSCSIVAQESLRVDLLSTDILAYATGQELHRDLQGIVIIDS